MKKLFTLIFIFSLFSCSTDKENLQEPENAVQKSNAAEFEKFKESTTFLFSKNITKSKLTTKSSQPDKVLYTVKITNFNSELKLKKAYKINNIAFNDDGKYFDEVAGDGIYTSVTFFNDSAEVGSSPTISDESFRFGEKQQKHSTKGEVSGGVGVSCSIRHDDCPEDGGFWDSDWGTGMGCIYFDDCNLEIGFSFDISW